MWDNLGWGNSAANRIPESQLKHIYQGLRRKSMKHDWQCNGTYVKGVINDGCANAMFESSIGGAKLRKGH